VTVGAWRTPLLVTGTLLALATSGPAAADLDDPRVRVGPRSVCVDSSSVSVHIGRCGRVPAGNRPATTVRILSDVPRPTRAPRRIRPPARVRAEAPAPVRQVPVPKPTPKPKPTPTPEVTRARLRAVAIEPPRRRPNPLRTVLLMVVLTTVIATASAVAFGVR
jgi:hypothetical protein